jgi:thymidylate synthase (FAD)
LPVGTYSQMIATCNARSLMAFLELRTHPRAQQEIRELAVEMLAIFTREMPITALAFELNGRIAP